MRRARLAETHPTGPRVTDATLSSDPEQNRLNANLFCVAAMMVWAVGFPMVAQLLPVMSPLALTAARLALGALSLLFFWLALEGAGTLARAPWRRGMLIGMIGFGAGAYLMVVAQSLTDGVTVAITSSALPIIGIGLECLLDGRRLTLALVAGLALSLMGGLVTYANGIGHLHVGLGAGAVLLSTGLYCWASRETVKGLPGLSPLGQTAITLAGASLATATAYGITALWFGTGVDTAAFDWRHMGYLALYGFGSLAVSQMLWIIGVGRLGVGIASLHINAAPFYVMLLFALGGAGWNPVQLLGALIVGAGVLIAQGRGRST